MTTVRLVGDNASRPDASPSGSPPGDCVIAVASRRCFAIPLREAPRLRWRDPATLAFDLEPFVPIDAESMAAAASGADGHGLAVACSTGEVRTTVDAVEKQGQWVAAISPWALLVCQACRAANHLPETCEAWLEEDGAWNAVALDRGTPVAWTWHAETEAAEALRKDKGERPRYVVGTPVALAHGDEPPSAPFTHVDRATRDACFASFCQTVADGRATPWIDWRGSAIPTTAPWRPIRGALAAFLFAVVLALVGTTFALVSRTMALANGLEREENRQAEAFRRLYPKAPVPVDVAGRLRSEEKKLRVLADEWRAQAPVASSFPTLVEWLNALPDDATWRVDSLRLVGDRFAAIDGSAETLADVERLAATLRERGFEVPAPAITQLKDGFSFHWERVRRPRPPSTETPTQTSATQAKTTQEAGS